MSKSHAIKLSPARLAKLAHAHIRSQEPRARQRLLSEADILGAIADHAKLVKHAPEGVSVVTRMDAGAVPNSYGYRAACDRLRIDTDADGATTVQASRGWAPNVAGGRGGITVHRYIGPGQIDGTIVAPIRCAKDARARAAFGMVSK